MAEINDISEDGAKKEVSHLAPIIKKVKKHGHGHHGGSWKIAFADFVTAMMAFFLLMWLVASLNKAQKAAIADYFKQPIKVALMSGENVGNREINVHLMSGENVGNREINVQGGGSDMNETQGEVTATTKPVSQKDKDDKIKNQEASSKADMMKLEEL